MPARFPAQNTEGGTIVQVGRLGALCSVPKTQARTPGVGGGPRRAVLTDGDQRRACICETTCWACRRAAEACGAVWTDNQTRQSRSPHNPTARWLGGNGKLRAAAAAEIEAGAKRRYLKERLQVLHAVWAGPAATGQVRPPCTGQVAGCPPCSSPPNSVARCRLYELVSVGGTRRQWVPASGHSKRGVRRQAGRDSAGRAGGGLRHRPTWRSLAGAFAKKFPLKSLALCSTYVQPGQDEQRPPPRHWRLTAQPRLRGSLAAETHPQQEQQYHELLVDPADPQSQVALPLLLPCRCRLCCRWCCCRCFAKAAGAQPTAASGDTALLLRLTVLTSSAVPADPAAAAAQQASTVAQAAAACTARQPLPHMWPAQHTCVAQHMCTAMLSHRLGTPHMQLAHPHSALLRNV